MAGRTCVVRFSSATAEDVAELHPLAVHLPIALVLLIPLIDLGGWVFRRPDLGGLSLVLIAVATVVSLVATTTGQAAYDLARDAGVERAILNEHADWANTVPWALLIYGGARWGLAEKAGRRGHGIAVAAGFALWALIWVVGTTGGQLVYEHGIGVRATKVSPLRSVQPGS